MVSLVITPISSPPVAFHRASHSVCIRDVEVCDRGVAYEGFEYLGSSTLGSRHGGSLVDETMSAGKEHRTTSSGD